MIISGCALALDLCNSDGCEEGDVFFLVLMSPSVVCFEWIVGRYRRRRCGWTCMDLDAQRKQEEAGEV